MFGRFGSCGWAILFLLPLVECRSVQKPAEPKVAWINNMHRLSTAYLELMPLVADGRAFADPALHELIQRGFIQMVQGSAETSHDPLAPSVDPVIAFSAKRFDVEMRQAYSAFSRGDQQWSRYALARAGDYCISCHTRADRGVKDFKLPWQPDLAALNPIQRVEFYLANRQYSSAALEAEKLAADEKSVRQDTRAWQTILEKVMALNVRVKKDPLAARALAERMVENRAAPNFVRRDALAWTSEIKKWQEKPVKYRTDKSKLLAAISLLNNPATPVFDRPHTALIANLRASGLLHEILDNRQSTVYAEALFYAGLAEETLRSINLFGLGQAYFESCVRKIPHTELAERCYARLESSVRASNPFRNSRSNSGTRGARPFPMWSAWRRQARTL